MPVVVITSLAQSSCRAAVAALEAGAVEVLAKPGGPYSVADLKQSLAAKIRAAAVARGRPASSPASAFATTPPHPVCVMRPAPGAILAIGASTGGTEAIADILRSTPAECPPILVAQHIPPVFSKAFASRLNEVSAVRVKEAEDGDPVAPGSALVAPGDYHIVLRRAGNSYFVAVRTGPRVCYQRPSIDVLFHSVAETAADRATGVLLTGMGSDGAQGLLRMRQAGAHTIAQDEASCVVFGMPREAIRLNAAAQVLPLSRIPQAMLASRASSA
jgi:two-component system chemotaxis response regulator CheB